MEKLELKHLAPYLPYKLMVKVFDEEKKVMNSTNSSSKNWVGIGACIKWSENCKPILRPLSDLMPKSNYKFLNKPDVELLGRKITSPASEYWGWVYFQEGKMGWNKNILDFEYWFVDLLLKHHFDVFGLIEKNLAIDINTLKL